jgi:toluene monooxygenase system ferredoxin subunit
VSWERVCAVADVPPNGMVQHVTEDGNDVLLLASVSERFACQAVCPHLDTPLAEGMFDGSTLTCHLHLWQWDISTGDALGLAELPLLTYAVKEEGGDLYVDLAT